MKMTDNLYIFLKTIGPILGSLIVFLINEAQEDELLGKNGGSVLEQKEPPLGEPLFYQYTDENGMKWPMYLEKDSEGKWTSYALATDENNVKYKHYIVKDN